VSVSIQEYVHSKEFDFFDCVLDCVKVAYASH